MHFFCTESTDGPNEDVSRDHLVHAASLHAFVRYSRQYTPDSSSVYVDEGMRGAQEAFSERFLSLLQQPRSLEPNSRHE